MTLPVYRVRVLAEEDDGSRTALGERLFAAVDADAARKEARDEFWDERFRAQAFRAHSGLSRVQV